MLLQKIKLLNFRQYYESQEIQFSTNPSRNITVIHGENGAGKTALLNAFNWCFYGKVDLPNPQELVNERAVVEANVGEIIEVCVEIDFEENNKTYTVRRIARYEKCFDNTLKLDMAKLTVTYIDERGNSVQSHSPQTTISQIMPEEMKRYFFFDGERIDKLSRQDNSEEIRHAIKNIMGLAILEKSVNDLESVKRQLRKDHRSAGGDKSRTLSVELEGLRDQRNSVQGDYEQQKRNEFALRAELDVIRERLRTLDDVKHLQTQIDRLTENRENVLRNLLETENELKRIISTDGATVFAVKAAKKVQALLQEKRSKGEIPSHIKRPFVDDILSRGECICGTPLTPGSHAYTVVSSWRDRAVTQEVEDAFIQSNSWVAQIQDISERTLLSIKALQAKKQELIAQRRQLDGEIADQKNLIKGRAGEANEAGQLAERLIQVEADLRRVATDMGALQERLSYIEHAYSEKEKEYEKVVSVESKGKLVLKQIDTCNRLITVMKNILDLQSKFVRDRLQERIDDVYGRFLRKGYAVRVNDDYILDVVKESGIADYNVGMSTGERQITSLAFIGAVVDMAREQLQKEPGNLTFPGGLYPIVMDSPFGALDSDHRRRIALGIPEMAHQIVVIVTTTQWRNEVEEAMRGRVGREYQLVYHDPRVETELKHESTEIREEGAFVHE